MTTRASWRRICAILLFARLIHASNAQVTPISQFRARDTDFDSSCKNVDPVLPDNFKCNSTSACISLDNSSSALCCPEGTCDSIKVVACDIQLMNATRNPDAQAFTTKLGSALPSCGQSNCCPFGYACVDSGSEGFFCQLDISTSHSGATNASVSAASTTVSIIEPTSTSSSTTSPTSATASAGIDSNKSLPAAKCNTFPAGVFLAGLFPGMFIGALSALAWVILSGRRKREDNKSDRDSVLSLRKGLVISAPLPHPSSGSRTDFLRRGMQRTRSMFSTRSGGSGADANHWKEPTPPVPSVPYQQGMPVTPEHLVDRPTSAESIKIYSPPSMIQHPSATVAPLRGMERQRPDSGFGSPFRTPQRPGQDDYNYNDPTYDMETLTPRRYDAAVDKGKGKAVQSEHDSNRDTSFTAMLEHCKIPDSGDAYPVPRVPQQYQPTKPYETRL